MAGYVKSLLDCSNIENIIKNQNLSGAIGELPPIECWPEVWILDEEDYGKTMQIINALTNEQSNLDSWVCSCGETIDGQFKSCWSCGSELVE